MEKVQILSDFIIIPPAEVVISHCESHSTLYRLHVSHRCKSIRTFDLLLVPEPAQVGGGLAALSDAGQSDVVSLQGGLRKAIDLRLLGHTYRTEWRITARELMTQLYVNNSVIVPYWKIFSSSSVSCREIKRGDCSRAASPSSVVLQETSGRWSL